MKVVRSERGFEFLDHPAYLKSDAEHSRLASQSSAVGDYEDAMARPGSSFLWVGQHHHLNRDEVKEFAGYLQRWLDAGQLAPKEKP